MSKPKSGEFEDIMTMDDKHIAIAEVVHGLLSEEEIMHVVVHLIQHSENPEAVIRYAVEHANDTIFLKNRLDAFYDINGEII
jgi:DNA-binding LytR/AlgR family response regulator